MTRSRNAYRRADWWSKGRPAYWVDTEPEAAEPPTPAIEPDQPLWSPDVIRYGYTMHDLHRIARIACNANRDLASDWSDRYDAAWHAVVEHLITADEPPTAHDLAATAKDAIRAWAQSERQTYGRRAGEGRIGDAPRFAAYWALAGWTPSHEDTVVDRIAVGQIVDTLSPRRRQVLMALATTDGDVPTAAALLGMTPNLLTVTASQARRRLVALWLEHETPVRRRQMVSRHLWRDEVLEPCGTMAAAKRHRRRGEVPLDDACAAAEAHYNRPYRDEHRRRVRAAA